MSTLACGHPTDGPGRRVCQHLLVNREEDYQQRFTGEGLAFDLVCGPCAREPAGVEVNLRAVCAS